MPLSVVTPVACHLKYVIPVHPAAGGDTVPLPAMSSAPDDAVKVCVPEIRLKSHLATLNTPLLWVK
jgi:hypothetical protein